MTRFECEGAGGDGQERSADAPDPAPDHNSQTRDDRLLPRSPKIIGDAKDPSRMARLIDTPPMRNICPRSSNVNAATNITTTMPEDVADVRNEG